MMASYRNAVPPPAAKAIGEAMIQALLPAQAGVFVLSAFGTAIWVRGAWRIIAAVERAAALARGRRP